jgi:hypothetical protein
MGQGSLPCKVSHDMRSLWSPLFLALNLKFVGGLDIVLNYDGLVRMWPIPISGPKLLEAAHSAVAAMPRLVELQKSVFDAERQTCDEAACDAQAFVVRRM